MKPISCANSLLDLVHLTIDLLPQPSFDVSYGIKWLQFSLRRNAGFLESETFFHGLCSKCKVLS